MAEAKSELWVISYRQIGVVIFCFFLGLIIALLFTNSQTEASTTFTTTELISFFLSVILSGASIVLAIAAIAWGKQSELAMTKRSDESIRLQNDVFIKTTEALQRIESSTGVTEKRIEDIISGRARDISHEVAEKTTQSGKETSFNPHELEKNIRESILNTLGNERNNLSITSTHKAYKLYEEEEAKRRAYQKAHEKIIFGIANLDGVSIEKAGHGNPTNDGIDLFDAIYNVKGNRFAASTFRYETSFATLTEYIRRAAFEISKQSVKSIYLYIFSDKDPSALIENLEKQRKIMNEDISKNIHIEILKYEDAEEKIKEMKLPNS